jgi:imidazolonepropionase-like amidohydrolase
MRRILVLLASFLLFSILAAGQAPTQIAIRAAKLIDGKNEKPLQNPLILIEKDKIVSVTAGGNAPPGVEVVDLANATVLPGFIDVHTHVLVQGDASSEEYDAQLLKQSIPYRAILAARNAQIALSHGFTAMRDLETEGAMYADVDLKKAIANAEVPGPRMQVATRAMSPTGMYPLLGYSWELRLPTGVEYVDGVDGARKAVREQVMYGADWIKYYSDRREHFEADGRLRSSVNFTDEEAKAIVEEAHRLGKKVAAHAIGSDGIARMCMHSWRAAHSAQGGRPMVLSRPTSWSEVRRPSACRPLSWPRQLRWVLRRRREGSQPPHALSWPEVSSTT